MEILISIIVVYALYKFILWFYKKCQDITHIKDSELALERKMNELEQKRILIQQEKEKLQEEKNELRKITEDNQQTSPWLAQKYADFWEMKDTAIEEYLRNKIRSAPKSADQIKEIKKEKRELLKENRMLTYQLNFLTDIYPWLETAKQEDIQDAKSYVEYIINKDDKEYLDEKALLKWLSPTEFQKLSKQEKYQLALDRYINRSHKSLWEIGISFERYIGYLCENRRFKVRYTGALEGVRDLGRDIIAEKDNHMIIIQCKYWRKERIVYPKDIMYFYGTVALEKAKNPNKKIDCIFATTTTLSDEAKDIAKVLNIDVREQMNFDRKYPCIKCNKNRSSGEKIYHFPFDQQYDRISIDVTKGECYVATVKEAEELGFRKAMKHYF